MTYTARKKSKRFTRRAVYFWIFLWAITFSFTTISHQYKHVASGDNHCEYCISGSLNAPPMHSDAAIIFPLKQRYWAGSYPVIACYTLQTRAICNRGPPASLV